MNLRKKYLELRAPEPEDLDVMYRWENDTDIWQVSNTVAPLSRYVLKQYLETAQADIYETKQLRLMIVRIEDNKPLGMIDLYDFDAFNSRAGVGIAINEKAERGKGYAAEALEIMTDYAFNHLGLVQLYCDISEDNLASLNLFKSQNFNILGKKEAWQKVGTIYKGVFMLQKLNPNRKF